MGTDTGTVHILDFSGQTETLQSLRCTQDSIHLISFSDDSMYLATAVGKLNFFFLSMAINPNGLVAVQRRGNRFLTYAFVVEI